MWNPFLFIKNKIKKNREISIRKEIFLREILKICIDLDKNLNDKQKQEIKNIKYNDLDQLHFGLGLYIRNNYNLWNSQSMISIAAREFHIHPDSISSIICDIFWKQLNKKKITIKDI